MLYEYCNETFSGCDLVASITLENKYYNEEGKLVSKKYTETLGTLQTVSYSIYMDKSPVRSIGNVNAKGYVAGPRTIAGSLVFSVFNKHFSQNIMDKINSTNRQGTAYLVDELPPFDITISGANEYGIRSRMVIYGIRLLNEGQVMSINDVYTENTYQYYAMDLEYLTDDNGYIKSKSNNFYTLSKEADYVPALDKIFKNGEILNKQYFTAENYIAEMKNRNIKLTAGITQPKSEDDYGIVDFSFSPGQENAKIYLSNDKGYNNVIDITADKKYSKYNLKSNASISLNPGTYTAYLINDNGIRSNSIKITVRAYSKTNPLMGIPSVVDEVYSNKVVISPSSSKITKLKIKPPVNGKSEFFITNGLFNISGLEPNTEYSIKTYSNDGFSDETKFKTLSDNSKLYKELLNHIKSNRDIIDDYNEIISLINKIEDKDLTPAEALSKELKNLKAQYRNLDIGDEDYKDKVKDLENKINIAIEALNNALDLRNNHASALNIKNNVKKPKKFYDKNLNICFQFSKYIEKAEIYRVTDNIVQFDSVYYNYDFEEIEGKSMCIRFTGRPGYEYFIQSIIKEGRSEKLKFYTMTDKEKQNYLNKHRDEIINIDNINNINKAENIVNKDFGPNISQINRQRGLMFNIKKMDNPIIISPAIINMDEDITIKTSINDYFSESDEMTFYLCIADYDDVTKKTPIYKIPFTNKDSSIKIERIYNNLKENIPYAIWVEDNNLKQISNPTTFVYKLNKEDYELIDDINKYEIKEIYNEIYDSSKNIFDNDYVQKIKGNIEYDDSLLSTEIISTLFGLISTESIKDSLYSNFIYKLKKYFGPFINSDPLFISNLQYNKLSDQISFNSKYKGTAIIYSGKNIFNVDIKPSLNILNLNNYDNNILIKLSDNKLLNCSDLILINKKSKKMEVM